jgi:glutaredoxin 3
MSAHDVVIYTTRICPYCVAAKRLFDSKKVSYKEIRVDTDADLRQEMMRKSGRQTVPQIWIGDTHVGGCDDLMALERAKKLDGMLGI